MATNEPTYDFDVADLRQIRFTTFQTVVSEIEKQIKKILQEKFQKIGFFSIGKTYTHATTKAFFLDPLNVENFTKEGISNRWRAHRETEYGKDGMVVVAIITNDVAYKLGYVNTEQCALDIERELQERFKSDDRLIHEDYHEGARVENPADGYPLYMTYAFTKRSSPSFTHQRETLQDPPLETRPYRPIQQQQSQVKQFFKTKDGKKYPLSNPYR